MSEAFCWAWISFAWGYVLGTDAVCELRKWVAKRSSAERSERYVCASPGGNRCMLGNFYALFSPKQVQQHFLGSFGEERERDFYQEGNLGCCSPTGQVSADRLLGEATLPPLRSCFSPACKPPSCPTALLPRAAEAGAATSSIALVSSSPRDLRFV